MPTALIIDDSTFMRNWVRHILENQSFTVVAEANNGILGVVQYKTYSPDIVLMDVVMPKMNGVRALEMIINFDPQAKVIISSSLGDSYLVDQCATIGAYDFIQKPFFDRLPSILDNII
ncbi:response regulator [Halobacillus litoralis]|uniref:Two-component system response regulator n=1 Tax=Halobacillus litoralis TaxID=45668 RepID=A0A410MDW4_9BACI|nr:response regulator [Halobacillus litoralis]QAS52826.1 two-component system response regulator [Halobacillus litoralis]